MRRFESPLPPAAAPAAEPALSGFDAETWIEEDADSAAPLARLCGAAALAILALAAASLLLA
jgi:hypothetical protein